MGGCASTGMRAWSTYTDASSDAAVTFHNGVALAKKAGEVIMQQHKTHFEAQRRAYAASEGRVKEAVRTNNPTFVHQPPPPESRIGAVPPASEADLPLLARRFLSEAKAEVTRLNEWKTTTELGRTRVNNMINRVFHRIEAADFESDVVAKLLAAGSGPQLHPQAQSVGRGHGPRRATPSVRVVIALTEFVPPHTLPHR